ncbi:hypothetical protein BTM25_27340 [Actinomadura rubteroloni]|uniref:Uncharacterized protein n=2 Tax=Actinomadura rubteroloni TaxID=1926885 RepID=A0A2P4UGD0_9ACTN|nr:hypothetical protein BTM25_27340 [Actinomadura rubteroloni]
MTDNGAMSSGPEVPDDDRTVEQDDELVILPDVTSDETDVGWGEWRGDASDDDRLLADRPPHW